MARPDVYLSGKERFFNEDEIIVSKTDLKGKITYGNYLFFSLAGYSEAQVIGQPHNMIRHPEMPRCVFKLLWDTLQAGKELFAYVVNRSANGDHYWVFAHVTPSKDASGNIVGYHSNRRVPNREVLEGTIIPLYKQLLAEEQKHGSPKDGMAAGTKMLMDMCKEKGMTYEELMFALGT